MPSNKARHKTKAAKAAASGVPAGDVEPVNKGNAAEEVEPVKKEAPSSSLDVEPAAKSKTDGVDHKKNKVLHSVF